MTVRLVSQIKEGISVHIKTCKLVFTYEIWNHSCVKAHKTDLSYLFLPLKCFETLEQLFGHFEE